MNDPRNHWNRVAWPSTGLTNSASGIAYVPPQRSWTRAIAMSLCLGLAGCSLFAGGSTKTPDVVEAQSPLTVKAVKMEVYYNDSNWIERKLPLTMKVRVDLSRELLPEENLSFALYRGQQEISRVPAAGVDSSFTYSLDVVQPGSYRIETQQGNREIGGRSFAVGSMPCTSDYQRTVLVKDQAPALHRKENGALELTLGRFVPIDAVLEHGPAYQIVWRKDGQTMHEERGRRSQPRNTDAVQKLAWWRGMVDLERSPVCAWSFQSESYSAPPQLSSQDMASGNWEIELHVEAQNSLIWQFKIGDDPLAVRLPQSTRSPLPPEVSEALSAVPVGEVEFPREEPKEGGLLLSGEEVRALVRSKSLLEKRVEFNEAVRATPVGEVTLERNSGESPDAHHRRQRAEKRGARAFSDAFMRKAKAKRRRLRPQLERAIELGGEPWRDSEHPLWDEETQSIWLP